MPFEQMHQSSSSVHAGAFSAYLQATEGERTFVDWLAGNNGDRLIRMGLKGVLEGSRSWVVTDPESADRILLNGGGAMNEFWQGGLDLIESYRTRYPDLPLVVGPSSFHLSHARFHEICAIASSPMLIFLREQHSLDLLASYEPPAHVELRLARDLALELQSAPFIQDLLPARRKNHLLIAMRGDREGDAGILEKARAPWLHPAIRRPLARVRTRLIARRSGRVLDAIARSQNVPKDLARVYCDASVSVDFDEFVTLISEAHTIITDRLHCGILGHMLNKRVVLRPGRYHKVRGVFEHSLSGPGARTILWAD